MKTVGITACSDAKRPESREQVRELVRFLEASGNRVLLSSCIFERPGARYSGEERAEQLMNLCSNPEVSDIYDISGGDMANEVLDSLRYEVIRESRAVFWGYSDLTTVINAIYTKTGKSSVLYSAGNLVKGQDQDLQRQRFLEGKSLFSPEFTMIQGDCMEGILVGGNIRCFLKLAGTEYFPDLQDKLLLLEARSGRVPQMVTFLSQLRSMGAFRKIKGILLGTFSQMEKEACTPDMVSLVQSFAGPELPLAKTREIGHGTDSKAIYIGKNLRITRET